LSFAPAKTGAMKGPERAGEDLLERRIEKKGLRPRTAASVIAMLWVAAVVAFGIVERLVDPDSFPTIWDGMWWATQTVTTVGYGDIVPQQTVGQVIAAILMITGLSLFAVVTGTITSAFVTRAQQDSRHQQVDELRGTLEEIKAELAALRADRDAGEPPGSG
jgi:voltage-gated potassium channel